MCQNRRVAFLLQPSCYTLSQKRLEWFYVKAWCQKLPLIFLCGKFVAYIVISLSYEKFAYVYEFILELN